MQHMGSLWLPRKHSQRCYFVYCFDTWESIQLQPYQFHKPLLSCMRGIQIFTKEILGFINDDYKYWHSYLDWEKFIHVAI